MTSVRFLTLEHVNPRHRYGSTRLRVHNLLRYWPEAGLWRRGDRPDVLVLQRVYRRFPRAPLTILDISDPDWDADWRVMDAVRQVDAVTCPTPGLAEFLRDQARQVLVIPDRHDVAALPAPREHHGRARRVVWFGWHHNAGPLSQLVPAVERIGLDLTVVSDRDPRADRWAIQPQEFRRRYFYRSFHWSSIHKILGGHDICLVPRSGVPSDEFKSDNRETLSLLCGVPTASCPATLLTLANDAAARSRLAAEGRSWALANRDCRQSVSDMQTLIARLRSSTTPHPASRTLADPASTAEGGR